MLHRLPIATLALIVGAIVVHLTPGATEALQFDRAAVARGEAWRWFTAHLTHFGLNHLAWDVGVLLALGAACERESRRRFAAAVILSAVIITPAVWAWQPQFATYRGLSGIDSSLFGLLAASLLTRSQKPARLVGALALVGFAGKCAVELATESPVFATGSGYAPVPLAHLLGLLAGITPVALPLTKRRCAIFRFAVSTANPPPCR